MAGFNIKFFPSEAQRLSVSLETADFNATNGKIHVINPAGATMNIQLPAPSLNFHCVIKDISGSLLTKTVNIVRNGTEKIDNVASNIQLQSDYGSIMLFSNGIDWFIL